MNYLKIKDDFDLEKLKELGFEKIDYTKGERGYSWRGVQYEIRDYYEKENDGSRYIDSFGNNYRSIISVSEKDRLLYIEIFNNDCSYHNEGNEVNFIANVIFELSKINCLEKADDK